jgi:hypothetical protein
VQPDVELLQVAQDLCVTAAALFVLGRISWAETLIEQSAELLAQRARLLRDKRASHMAT